MASIPPKSKLPLKWTRWNGCREMDHETTIANIQMANLETCDSLQCWLASLSISDRYAWFCSIGWPEGYFYCSNPSYLRVTGFPCLAKEKENRLCDILAGKKNSSHRAISQRRSCSLCFDTAIQKDRGCSESKSL